MLNLFNLPEPPFTQVKSYFNTTRLSGDELQKAKNAAVWQEDRVMFIFKNYDSRLMPCEVSKIYDSLYPPAPLTSIRRSITCLTKKGLLRKTTDLGLGKYGANNFYWQIV